MATNDVLQWIDRWDDRGLLEPDVSTRLRDDVASVRAAGGDAGEDLFGRARGMVLEAVGYLGAALTVGALGILFDVADWPQFLVVLLLLAASAVGAWGVWTLTPASSGAGDRLASVAAATSVASLAGALFLATEPDCFRYGSVNRCAWWEDNLLPFVILVVVTALAVVLYRRHATAITHVVVGWSVGALTWATAHLPFGPRTGDSSYWREEEVAFGALLTVVAAGWVWASETGRLRPAWVGTFGAAAAFFAGLVMVTGYDPFFGSSGDTPILAALLAGCVWLGLGITGDRLRLTIVGVVALLFTIPATLTEVLGLDGVTVTFVMLPVGLVLLGWAIREGRRSPTASATDQRQPLDV